MDSSEWTHLNGLIRMDSSEWTCLNGLV